MLHQAFISPTKNDEEIAKKLKKLDRKMKIFNEMLERCKND